MPYGRPGPVKVVPLREFLGGQTLHAVKSFQSVTASILKRPTRPNPPRHARLTPWRKLTGSQVEAFRRIVGDPASYWNGWPIYRRFPPRPGFALRLVREGLVTSLLADLQNPGWEFHCHDETYWGFHFAGDAMAALAKSIFPEYASPDRRSVWKKGVLDDLEQVEL